MSAETTTAPQRGGLGGVVDRARVVRPLVKAAQLGLTGGYVHRLNRLLADQLTAGAHDFVLELGCGDAPLLRKVHPKRYVGLDFNPGSIKAARRRYGGSGAEFVEADICSVALDPWRGADAVVCSAVFHHLPDAEVTGLVRRVFEQVGAERMVCTDGVMVGPFRRAITWLDEGEPTRSTHELYELLSGEAEVSEKWSFVVPFRTVSVFGFELTPKRPG